MKLRKIVFASSLFFAWSVTGLAASSPAVEKASVPAAPAEAAVTPAIPVAAEAPGLQDLLAATCADGFSTSSFGGPQLPQCGSCSPSLCSGATLNSRCGTAVGPIKRCLDTGLDCPDGLPLCQCSPGPV